MLDTDRSYEKKGVCEQSNLGSVPKNLITGKFTYISHFKRVEIILQSWGKMQRLSNSNVFPAIAVFAPGCVDNNLMIRASYLEKGKALGTRLTWSIKGQVYLYLTKCWLEIKYSLNKLSKCIYSATAVVAKGFWLRSNYKIETSLSFYLEHNLPSRCTASSQAFSVIAFR